MDDHQDRQLVDERLAEMVAVARAAWPSVVVSAERFAAYLGEHLPAGDDIAQAISGLHGSDLYLACACADGDAAAIAAFDQHCMTAVNRTLSHLRIDPDVAAEVKQRLRTSLFVADAGAPKIVSFAGRGDMRNWVRVMAVREALALTRAARRCPASDDPLHDAMAADDDPEVQYLKRRYRNEVQIAFGQAVEQLTSRDRLFLRQHYLDGVTVGRLAKLHHIHRSTAARWLYSARTAVFTRTRAILLARFGIAPAEFDSIMRLIESQLAMNARALCARGRS